MQPIQARSLRDLLNDPIKPNDDWVVGLIPRSAKVLYGGEAKIGKSFIGLEVLRALAANEPPFGVAEFEVRQPTRAIYIEKELGPDELKRRCHWTFAHEDPDAFADRIHYMSSIPSLKMDDGTSFLKLRKIIDELKPNVIFLDPVSKFMSGDDSSNPEVAKLCEAADRLIDYYRSDGLSVIMAHHFTKPSYDRDGNKFKRDGAYNFRGASRWYDDPDVVITMERIGQHGVAPWDVTAVLESRRGRLPGALTLRVHPEQSQTPVVVAVPATGQQAAAAGASGGGSQPHHHQTAGGWDKSQSSWGYRTRSVLDGY